LERTPGPKIAIAGSVALASFVALSDGYLQKLADCYTLFASTAEARSADWDVIRTPLGAVAERNVSALVWFALPDGSYWSVQQGKSSGNLSDRDYFPRVLAGETVIGALVVSKATGKASAIVAVPVRGDGGVVVGVLGASVNLDELSDRLNHEMALGENVIFYSFDATPLLALEWDPQLTFVDPFSLGPEIRAAFEYMLSRDEGTVRYRFRNQWRTVIFKQSQVTGWWYAFGEVGGNEAEARSR
jgi:methyl-accepting chemotaxis protein